MARGLQSVQIALEHSETRQAVNSQIEMLKYLRDQYAINKNGAEGAAKGVAKPGAGQPQRTISNPEDVAKLVMMQIDAVGGKKDELTIALKQLTDTMRQLVRAFAQQAAVIQGMAKNIKELEEKSGAKK